MKQAILVLLNKHLKVPIPQLEPLLEVPKDSALGDYAFPCFVLAKEFKKSPQVIAQELAHKIKPTKDVSQIQAVGPYLNFFVNGHARALSTLKAIEKQKAKYGASKPQKKKIVMEFPSPNTNKPLHIGHARNIVLGQAVANILKFQGNKVVVVNLNNDRGVHICKSMVAYDLFGKNDSPEKAKKKSDHFVGDYYVKFAQSAKDNPQLEKQAQEYLQKWEAGDKKVHALWKKMNDWALKGFSQTYKLFGLKIDKQYFESKIYNDGKQIVFDALKKGLVQRTQDGAYFIDLTARDLGEKIVLRADGTSIYITQDMYLATLKQKEFKPDQSIIVSATEQNHHFKVLFALLEKLGFNWVKNSHHLNYGMVNLESGRMKSREGNVVDSDELIQEMSKMAGEEISKRHQKLAQSKVDARAHAIALGAIRYYYLKVDRLRDVTFKPEESLKFEGDTGPYLMYTYARACSILSKAQKKKSASKVPPALSEHERKLITLLEQFPQVVESAATNLAPNLVANYAFHLAQAFNEFYHASKVIGSAEEVFRLQLVRASTQVLANALNLLNIAPIEQM